MGSFYSRIDKDIVPLKVDYMSLRKRSDNSKVDRFVILTESQLIVYEEDKIDSTFYESTLDIKLAKMKKFDENSL
jgi:hypothetical protein